MNTVPEIEKYESLVYSIERSYEYAISNIALSPNQALFFAEEHALANIYEPFESYVVQLVALLKVGINYGVEISRDDEDGAYILDELGRKYKACRESLKSMIDDHDMVSGSLKSDLDLVVKLYEKEF